MSIIIIIMATKEELVNNIKEWMQIEDEMKVLQKELKERRIKKKTPYVYTCGYYENERY